MKKHFLVVDDSELNLRVVQAMLEKNNISADYVTCADHAFTALTESDYDLVLMDYLMPGMNGVEATKFIRKMSHGHKKEYYKNLPIIALTAEDNKEQLDKMKKAGINDVLNKPIQPKAFRRILDQWAPTVHGIDENTLIGMLDADRSSYLELVSMFCNDIPGKHERIEKALAANNYEEYTVEVHKIKSEAKVIGATALAEASKVLEFTGKAITGVVPNGKTEEENKKIIHRDNPKVMKALDSIGRELTALLEDNQAMSEEIAKANDAKVESALRPELEKLVRYTEHAREALTEQDYALTGEWIGEISEVLKKLLD